MCGCEGFFWLASTGVAAVGEAVPGAAVVSEVGGWQIEGAARAALVWFVNVGVVVHQIHPYIREQPGQAFQPDLAKTFSATAICSSLEASHGWSAYSPPPKDSQVE